MDHVQSRGKWYLYPWALRDVVDRIEKSPAILRLCEDLPFPLAGAFGPTRMA